MAKSRPHIYLIGAHSAVAKGLIELVEERELEVELTPATTSEHLGEGLDLVDEAQMRSADLIVLAFSGKLARGLAEAARALGKPVLDLSETLAGEKRAEWIFPGVDPDAGRSFDPTTYALIPVGLGAPIVALLRALAELEPTRATIATYESTSSADQPGMDELSDQIRARFNMRDVEPSVFTAPIAFACVPVVGRAGTSPFDADETLRSAIEAGVEDDLPELDLSITRILVPTFSADSAVVVIDFAKSPAEEAIAAALKSARGIHYLAEELPSSLAAVDRDDALAGRVSVEPDPSGGEGGRASLWIACDRLRRGSATLAALAIERWVRARSEN